MIHDPRNPPRPVRFAPVLAAGLCLALACVPPARGPRDETVDGKVETDLAQPLTPPTHAGQVVSMVFSFATAEALGSASFVPVPSGSLKRSLALDVPGDALDRPGLYLAVFDDQDNPTYVLPLSDPRYVRMESVSGGTLESRLVRTEGGVFSARFPLVLGGRVEVFETSLDEAAVSYLSYETSHPIPPRGLRFGVKL